MSDWLAEAALAVGVVLFGCGSAELLGAARARTVFVVNGRFVLFQFFARRSDLVSFRREDDALDGVFGVGLSERAFVEVGEADLEAVDHDAGGLGVDSAAVEGVDDEEDVGLDGGAVFGEEEGQGFVDAVVLDRRLDLVEGFLDELVVAAEVGAADGGSFAGGSFRLDVTA